MVNIVHLDYSANFHFECDQWYGFLVACKQLYKPLCWSVRRWLVARSTRLIAIGLVSAYLSLGEENPKGSSLEGHLWGPQGLIKVTLTPNEGKILSLIHIHKTSW